MRNAKGNPSRRGKKRGKQGKSENKQWKTNKVLTTGYHQNFKYKKKETGAKSNISKAKSFADRLLKNNCK